MNDYDSVSFTSITYIIDTTYSMVGMTKSEHECKKVLQ